MPHNNPLKFTRLLILGGFIFPLFAALAQSDGSLPPPSSETPQEAVSATIATSTPRATEIQTALPATTTPRETPAVVTPQAPAATPPVVAPVADIRPTENDSADNFGLVAIVSAIVLGILGILGLKMKKGGQNNKEEKKDDSRCFNIKKLLDQKLEELTDLKGKLASGAQEKVRDKAREATRGTSAGEILALIESAEKECGRLKQLYEKCILELQIKKRVFIVHGWDGYPEEGWFPWLKQELEKKGFEVQVPVMPEPAEPKIEAWVSYLSKVVGEVDKNTFFIGHSIGCQTIIRYLESLPVDKKIGGAVFVAGWFTLMNSETEEEKRIGKPWLETPIDFEKVKRRTKNLFALFSDNDEFVPKNNKEFFEQRLGAKTAIEHGKGHFGGGDGVTELPIVLDKILEM